MSETESESKSDGSEHLDQNDNQQIPIDGMLMGQQSAASDSGSADSGSPDLRSDAQASGTTPRPPSHRRVEKRSFLGRHPWRLTALIFIVAVLVAGVSGVFWLNSEANPSGKQGAQILVTVPKNATAADVTSILQQKGIIGSALAFRIWLRLHGAPIIVAGSYAFNKNDSFNAAKDVLTGTPNVFVLTIPPGFTVSEVAERVGQYPGHDQTTFDQLATSGQVHSPWEPVGSTSLEGLLGTGNYTLTPGETDLQLLTAMVDQFTAQANKAGLTAGAAALGMTPYQVIIVASIDEKEGVIAANVGPVARVIYNRLANNMPLQMDSTVLYSENRDGGPVSSADEKLQTPYNTYLNNGLTPTPICLPSTDALVAAINPPPGDWLFFQLVNSDGTEAFSSTLAGQDANEKLAQERGLP